MRSTYVIKELVNGKAYYSSIEIEISETSPGKVEIEYDTVFNSDQNWYLPIKQGVDFFASNLLHTGTGLHIKVVMLHTMIVDSTPETVSFVTFMALLKAYNIEHVEMDIFKWRPIFNSISKNS